MDEPRHPAPREGRWFAEPRPIRRTARKMPKWYVWLWMPSTLCRGIVRGVLIPDWVRLAEAAGWLLFVILAVWWFVSERIALRTTKADRNFSDRPTGLEEFPLEVVIFRDEEEVGMDRGLAWFEDGLFYFNGTATSFVLSSAEFVCKNKLKLDMSGQPKDYIELRNSKVRAALRLMPIGGWNWVQFRHRFGQFLSEPPHRTAIRQWPPFVAYDARGVALVSRSPELIGAEAAREGSATGVVRT